MITSLSPALARVAALLDPRQLLLQKESWVFFTQKWKGTWDWVSNTKDGKLFRVTEEPSIVNYALSWILPGADYKKVDLSNASGGAGLYPADEGILYQIGLGMKPGDYLLHIDVPKDQYAYALGYSGMNPDLTSATLLYLGAKKPADSPAGSPLVFLYAIKDAPAFYLKPYVKGGVPYDKVTIELTINKCRLSEIASPAEDQIRKATKIPFPSELTGF